MERLQKHFDTVLESPDGIKKLRELIFTLAMQGKLVKQDPNDQPASELLKEIQAEEERLIKEGKIKKQKELPPIKPEEMPYEVPKGWVWTRLSYLMLVLNGRAYKQQELLESGVPVLRVGNLFTSKNWYYSDLQLDENKYINNGDLIYAWSASFGPFIWSGEKVIYHYHIWKLDLFRHNDGHKKFIFNYLLKQTDEIKQSGNGIAMMHMTKERMEKLLIPLPPLAEQKRIVAKIDELMALCDKLEAQRNARNDKRLAAHTAVINRLLTAADKKDFDSSWQFITRHFDPLYSVKENITELKKAILTLAMQGKLVKQDPNDQPASELLMEIQAENEGLIKEGKFKKQKELPPIKPEEVPYEVPEGWKWTRLGDFIYLEMGQSPDSKSYNQLNEGLPFFQGKADFGKLFPTPRYWCTNPTKLAFKNDVLLSVRAPVGPTNISNINCCIGRGLAALRPLSNVQPEFVNFLMINFRKSLEEKSTGTTFAAVSKVHVENLIIPLPPLAEQKRIVAKIDELMALCDKLENQIEQATAKQTALFDAVLAKVS